MIRSLLLFSLILPAVLAQKHPGRARATKWLTLSGKEPVVAARGGFSGLFPYGSFVAIDTMLTGSMNGQVVMYCDLHLTKDGAGICQPSVTLDNTTSISASYPDGKKTHKVNGKDVTGWFAADYTMEELASNVTWMQNVMSRPSLFDGSMLMMPFDEIITQRNLTFMWLNLQYESFYQERDLSPIQYAEDLATRHPLSYVSSPDISILKAFPTKKKTIKRIFQFLGANEVEPSTKQTYGDILKNLASVKAFASGIIVPKEYIWPVKPDKYLEPATTLVADAHKLGLEVYASVFANDQIVSLNYTMDPVLEYLQFIDNSHFAVDGLISDFPPTAEEASLCFAHTSTAPRNPQAKTVIISHNGASGIYPGSTDLAYQQAVADGADVIDCSVQMTKDGVAFCLDNADLTASTTAITTFMARSISVPEIQPKSGIFSFDLTWTEIQTLKPQIVSPYGYQGFQRDPHNKNKGKFVTLGDFIELAKTSAVRGIMIKVENAPFLASKRGLDIVAVVTSTLSNTTLDKKPTLEVIIQSDDSSVLSRFKDVPTYKRLFRLDEVVESIPKTTTDEVKKYADGVVVTRLSVLPTSADFFLTHETTVVNDLHAANISVYVFYLRNEYVALAFDYNSDPTLELATLITGYGVDGIITDFPATASRYLKNKCFDKERDPAILPVPSGGLLAMVEAEPPAGAPGPALEVADVVDPPLPPVNTKAIASSPPTPVATATAPAPKSSGASGNAANVGLSLVAVLVLRVLFYVEY